MAPFSLETPPVWNIAVKMLTAQRGKLLTALVGVVFSIVLVNVQGGLFVGLIRKAGLLVDQGDADIWIGHKRMNNVDFPHDIPRSWGQRIRSVAGVAQAEPYLVGHAVMTLPSGGFEQVLVVGSDPASRLGLAAQARAAPDALRQPDAVMVDRLDAHKIDDPQLGDLREIGGRRARITGFTEGVLGFLVTPYVFTTLERATEYLHRPTGRVSYFLVKVAPGADVQRVCQQISQRLPDAEVYPSDHYANISIAYWLQRTGIGISFGAATALGLVVGLVIVAQTLYASVLDRLAEFGALKAIGARDGQILGLILNQALVLAAVGSAVGLAVAALLQQTCSSPRAPIAIPWQIAAGSCLLVSVICVVAAVAPYLRVRRIDPAMVLQS